MLKSKPEIRKDSMKMSELLVHSLTWRRTLLAYPVEINREPEATANATQIAAVIHKITLRLYAPYR